MTKKIHLHPKEQEKYAVVDDEDFDRINAIEWTVYRKHGPRQEYAGFNKGGRRAMMHHMVLPQKTGYLTDHINGNGLDNRRENLRYATHAENSQNRSGWRNKTSSNYKGVFVASKVKGTYIARLHKSGVNYQQGPFETQEDASRAYDEMAIEHFGEFAKLNGV